MSGEVADREGEAMARHYAEVQARPFRPLNADQAERLLAHVMTADTRWFKVSFALLNFGRRNVPETRDSYNPVKWLAAELGLWMDARQTEKTNRGLVR